MPKSFDRIDRKILRTLQQHGRLQNNELAEEVGLSTSPCLRRVRRLEKSGAIKGYTAFLDGPTIGLPLVVFTHVTLDRQDKSAIEDFAKTIAKVPEVLECYLMAGNYDYLLKVAAEDLVDYQRFQMQHLTPMPGVRNVVTEIPLNMIKTTTALPL